MDIAMIMLHSFAVCEDGPELTFLVDDPKSYLWQHTFLGLHNTFTRKGIISAVALRNSNLFLTYSGQFTEFS